MLVLLFVRRCCLRGVVGDVLIALVGCALLMCVVDEGFLVVLVVCVVLAMCFFLLWFLLRSRCCLRVVFDDCRVSVSGLFVVAVCVLLLTVVLLFLWFCLCCCWWRWCCCICSLCGLVCVLLLFVTVVLLFLLCVLTLFGCC